MPNTKTSGGSPNVWKAPPKVAINVDKLLQQAMVISHHKRKKSLLFNLEHLRQDQQKKTMLVFVVDKRTNRIVKTTKDLVTRLLASLGVNVQAIIAGTSYTFWDVLLLTIEDAIALMRKTLETKEYIFKTEYLDQWRIMVAVDKVPSNLIDKNLAAYRLQFGDVCVSW